MTILEGRLAELADQATEYCKTQPREIAGSMWEKKFADLIIKEVYKVFDDNFYGDPHHVLEYIEDIEKHFGVEQ